MHKYIIHVYIYIKHTHIDPPASTSSPQPNACTPAHMYTPTHSYSDTSMHAYLATRCKRHTLALARGTTNVRRASFVTQTHSLHYTHTHIHTHTHTYTHTHTRTHTHTHTTAKCAEGKLCDTNTLPTLHTYTHTYTHTHTHTHTYIHNS